MGKPIKAKHVGACQDIPWPARAQVYNNSGSDISADDLVYFTAQRGLVMEVTAADADAAASAITPLWIARHDIPNGEYGEVVPWKLVRNVNTAAGSVGDSVYVSGTAGGWSLTPGTFAKAVGIIVSDHASTGAVLLQPTGMGGVSRSAMDGTLALVGAGSMLDLDATINNATAEASAADFSLAQITTNRTAGVASAVKGRVTSLSGDTAGVDYACFEGFCTTGEANADHSLLYSRDAMDNFAKVAASGDAGITVAADGMTKNPESQTEDGYITIEVGTTQYQIPIYAA
mgnify:CR=1 FL=1